MPHDVFLSYASADRAAADAVCAALEARGIACWMAPRDVPAGADWGEAILTAIGRAHAMVLVLSRNTSSSVHVRNEVVTAVSQSLALVPVRIEDCQPGGALRLHLAGSHWLNVFPPPIEQHADALVAGVRLALAADATVEIPRAQAAAMVAAARAAMASGPLPVAARSAAPAGRSPAQAARTDPAPAGSSTRPARPGRNRRGLMILALSTAILLAALGLAAWMFEPELRAMFGARSAQAPAAMMASAPGPAPPQQGPAAAASDGAAPPAGAFAGFSPSVALPALPPFAPGGGMASPPAPSLPSATGLSPAASIPGLGASPPLSDAPALAVPVPAPPLRLTNAGARTISRLFVARPGAGLGQEDWLGRAQITPGYAVLLRAPPGQGCVFDIRVVYVGGQTEDRPGVDLCGAGELRFDGGTSAALSRQ